MPSGIYVKTKEHRKHLSESIKKLWEDEKYAKRMSDAHIGQIPWIKGKKHPSQSKKMKGDTEKKARNWKGDNAGMVAIHIWIRQWYVCANHCELCGKRGNGKGHDFEWVNLRNHKYKRDINDFIQLCRKCHKNLDMENIDIETIRKLRKGIFYEKLLK